VLNSSNSPNFVASTLNLHVGPAGQLVIHFLFLACHLSHIHSQPLLPIARGGSSTPGRRRRWRVERAQPPARAKGTRPPAAVGDSTWRQSLATGTRGRSLVSDGAEATARGDRVRPSVRAERARSPAVRRRRCVEDSRSPTRAEAPICGWISSVAA
jgi:hypothetical protein